jgi:hypothetical protein
MLRRAIVSLSLFGGMNQTYEEGTVFVKVDHFRVTAVSGAADTHE